MRAYEHCTYSLPLALSSHYPRLNFNVGAQFADLSLPTSDALSFSLACANSSFCERARASARMTREALVERVIDFFLSLSVCAHAPLGEIMCLSVYCMRSLFYKYVPFSPLLCFFALFFPVWEMINFSWLEGD